MQQCKKQWPLITCSLRAYHIESTMPKVLHRGNAVLLKQMSKQHGVSALDISSDEILGTFDRMITEF